MAQASTRNSSRRDQIILTIGSLLVSLCVLEIGLRVYEQRIPTVLVTPTYYLGWQPLFHDQPNPGYEGPVRPGGYVYTYVPGSTWATQYPDNPRGYFDANNRVFYRINDQGFRGPALKAVKSGPRVVSMGDSYTLGEGVKLEDTFTERLRAALVAKDENSEIANFGINGLDLLEERLVFEKHVDSYDPDYVLWGYFINDVSHLEFDHLARELMERREKTQLRKGRFRILTVPSQILWNRWVSKRTIDRTRELYRQRWGHIEAELDHVRDLTIGQGRKALFLLFPDLMALSDSGYEYRDIHRRFGDLLSKRGIPHIDLTDLFAENDPKSLWVHPADAHPNERAHALVAEVVGEKLKQDGF